MTSDRVRRGPPVRLGHPRPAQSMCARIAPPPSLLRSAVPTGDCMRLPPASSHRMPLVASPPHCFAAMATPPIASAPQCRAKQPPSSALHLYRSWRFGFFHLGRWATCATVQRLQPPEPLLGETWTSVVVIKETCLTAAPFSLMITGANDPTCFYDTDCRLAPKAASFEAASPRQWPAQRCIIEWPSTTSRQCCTIALPSSPALGLYMPPHLKQ